MTALIRRFCKSPPLTISSLQSTRLLLPLNLVLDLRLPIDQLTPMKERNAASVPVADVDLAIVVITNVWLGSSIGGSQQGGRSKQEKGFHDRGLLVLPCNLQITEHYRTAAFSKIFINIYLLNMV